MTPMISGKKLAIVPILRAGLGMVNGILALVPSAKVGHIGLYRDEETHEPHEYYCKLPDPIDQRLIVVLDPMLATGGSAIAAIDFIKAHGGKSIKFMSIIAAPEGVEPVSYTHLTSRFNIIIYLNIYVFILTLFCRKYKKNFDLCNKGDASRKRNKLYL